MKSASTTGPETRAGRAAQPSRREHRAKREHRHEEPEVRHEVGADDDHVGDVREQRRVDREGERGLREAIAHGPREQREREGETRGEERKRERELAADSARPVASWPAPPVTLA